MLKVVLVDDSLAIQRSLSRVLRSIPGVDLAGVAGDLATAMTLIEAERPDVVLLDVNLPHGEKGIDVLHQVQRSHPQAQVIVLTNAVSPKLRQSYLDAGALGYYDKSAEFGQACAWIAERARSPRP
jgi:DNA-binding NarL/FixJ family response regulator